MEKAKKYIQSILWTSVIKTTSWIKLNYIAGLEMSWFSFAPIFMPLTGAFMGVFGSSTVFLMRLALKMVVCKSLSLSLLALYLPGYCASLYWATNTIMIRALLPLACMVFFVIHPVGSQAFVYSLYWFIPVMLYFYPHRSLLLQALGSTFTAHAVGSVIVLYTLPTTADMWFGLLSIVPFERCCFAVGMVVVYKMIMYVKTVYLRYVAKNRSIAAFHN